MAYRNRNSQSLSSDDANDGQDPDAPNGFSNNIFRNDGSFLEMFKKMQNASQMKNSNSNNAKTDAKMSAAVKAEIRDDDVADKSSVGSKPPPPPPSFVGRRRCMRVLPVGKVKKLKTDDDSNKPTSTSTDAWAKYLEEVKKYKETYCDGDSKVRSLVK